MAATPDGRTPAQQLLEIRDGVELVAQGAEQVFLDQVVPGLAEGVTFSSWDELDEDDLEYLGVEFEERIFPVLTPLAVDPGHPFPYISDLSLNLAVVVRNPAGPASPASPTSRCRRCCPDSWSCPTASASSR